jgi:hypothetical protein
MRFSRATFLLIPYFRRPCTIWCTRRYEMPNCRASSACETPVACRARMMILRSRVVRAGSGDEGIELSLARMYDTAEWTDLQAGPFWAPTAPLGHIPYLTNHKRIICVARSQQPLEKLFCPPCFSPSGCYIPLTNDRLMRSSHVPPPDVSCSHDTRGAHAPTEKRSKAP